MSRDAEDDDHSTFFRLTGKDEDADAPVVSRAGFMLHASAMVHGVRDGTPGFISDDYLNAISAETTVTATELCMARLWERDDDRRGYTLNDPMVKEVVGFHKRMDDDRRFCQTTGGHEASAEFGPDLCSKCHAPLPSE